MKKFSGKVFAGVFAAAVMASAAFASVSAADYATNPSWAAPKVDDVTVDDVNDAIKDAETKDTVTVEVEGDGASLSKNAVEAVKASGKALEVKTESATIKVSADELKNVDSSIDLGMGVDKATDALTVGKVSVPKNSVLIQPAAKGDFGFKVSVEVEVPAGLDAEKAKLYYVDGNNVTEVKDGLTVENGKATITISHASYYIISDGEVKGEEGKGDNVNTGVTLPIALVALAGGSVAVSAIAAKKRK